MLIDKDEFYKEHVKFFRYLISKDYMTMSNKQVKTI
jgi:hypothetical protein